MPSTSTTTSARPPPQQRARAGRRATAAASRRASRRLAAGPRVAVVGGHAGRRLGLLGDGAAGSAGKSTGWGFSGAALAGAAAFGVGSGVGAGRTAGAGTGLGAGDGRGTGAGAGAGPERARAPERDPLRPARERAPSACAIPNHSGAPSGHTQRLVGPDPALGVARRSSVSRSIGTVLRAVRKVQRGNAGPWSVHRGQYTQSDVVAEQRHAAAHGG